MDQSTLKDKKILMLDSEKNVLYTYRAVLEDEDFNVTIASSLRELPDILSRSAFDILITELYLNGHNTLEFIKEIQKTIPDIYIIMLTSASFTTQTYSEVISSGVQDLLIKPFPISNLSAIIKKGLRVRSLMLEKRGLESKLGYIEKVLFHQRNITHPILLALQQEVIRAKRYQTTFSMLIIDDHCVKNCSDDDRLAFDSMLSSRIRLSDIFGKFNGAYVFLLPETSKTGVCQFSTRLSKIIEGLSLPAKQHVHIKSASPSEVFLASYPEESGKIIEWMKNVEKNLENVIVS